MFNAVRYAAERSDDNEYVVDVCCHALRGT